MAIQVLDQNTINKIAAGEVIERPSSVVKELVENAIDAKATAVTIEIKDGGISFIRVTDNGCGIDKNELPMAFLRHSTSKIKSVEDLMCVASLGFRGEALSSIASVAQVELITKTSESFIGARYVIEGGMEGALEEIGAPNGTTFIVRNLFYNTPVRRKFLKSATTEAGYVNNLVEHLALSHPEISFRFINNGQNKLHTFGNGNLKDIIYHVSGRDITSNLLQVDTSTQDVSISGFIGKPIISRGNRSFENYFINGRYIKSSVISRAIEEAYKGYIMGHQYPFTALHFKINPQIMDVNVHPTKMELRFSNNEYVYNFVYQSIRTAITHKELVAQVHIDDEKIDREEIKKEKSAPQPFETKRIQKEKEKEKEEEKTVSVTRTIVLQRPKEVERTLKTAVLKEDPVVYESKPLKEVSLIKNEEKKSTPLPEENKPKQISLFEEEKIEKKPEYKIIGQLFDTYWMIEFEDKLFMMDQHAAHEKILYEKTMHLLENKQMDTQLIAPAIILSLSLREEEILKNNMNIFKNLGFEIESFGGREYKLTGVPASLPSINDRDLFIEILDTLADESLGKNPDIITEKVASMSCKAAIKGNMKMSYEEAKNLIDTLMQADNPYNCPHGRPTLISMTKYEIEKKFKRIV